MQQQQTLKLETETKVSSKNTPAITAHATGATEENEMKIFEIRTYTRFHLFCLIITKTEV